MVKFLTAAWRSCHSGSNIQPLLMFLMGVGFMTLGFRTYPAFIGVGGLFLIISYRGFTCRADD
ncbi:MAG: hypothetical protein GY732_01375 [Gammaproteobacteria bacterium]|nr:hypothetical protein [Gammaproteobacteria bacterium]